MVMGFTDPGGARPTPNRPKSAYQSKRPSFSGFQDPGISAGQYGFGSSSGSSKASNRPTTPGSGYTPGGNSFQNYSQKDQAVMFNQAGGKDKFIQQAIQQQEKYPRALNYQKYLDDAKRYQAGLMVGGNEVKGPDGILRLQMAGADTPMRDAQGRQILSMQAPSLTAQAPTMSQLFGDMGRGVSNIFSAIAEKGTPMMAFAKDLFGGIQNFFGDQMASQNQFSQQLMQLSPEQRRVYDQLIFQPGMTRERAYAQAVGQQFASGGIATFN